MDIKIGTKDSEVTFHYVNVEDRKNKETSEHITNAGVVKFQEAPNSYKTFNIEWVCLTKAERDSLEDIHELSGELNLQLESESYSDHTVKFRGSLRSYKSKRYPGYYEASGECIEVG